MMQSIAIHGQITAFLESVGSLGIMLFAGLFLILILCFNIIISFFPNPQNSSVLKKCLFLLLH